MQGELSAGDRRCISPESIRGPLPPRALPAISFTDWQTFKDHPCPPKSLDHHNVLSHFSRV